MLMKKLILGVIALGISSFAFASGDTFVKPKVPTYTPGIYLGLQGGYSIADWNSVVSDNTKFQVNNYNDFGFRGYLGYDIIKYLGLEAGYTQFFNKPKIANTGVSPVVTYQPSTFGTYALDLSLKLKAPIVDDFNLYAKVGGDYISIDEGLDGKKHDAFNALFGVGVDYYFTKSFSVDFSWVRYNGFPKLDGRYIPTYDLFAAGLAYKFNFA